ncbi:hypothetical protein ACFV0T_01205 [Streptomyces sp. NPDC059582]|uniref:hypothetical protein n=1 Tax=Streptomyces sp. NPDC059582 TaxID=3346875 RepID=UPI003675E256
MSERNPLLPYPERRALEHAAFTLGLRPTSIHAVLLPVWCQEVRATVTDGQPYELIDRFVELGIAEGGFGSAAELASFLALDPALVRQALAFLTAIDHVTERDGRTELTGLGHRSVRDGTRYTVTRGDRRRLYFDGFQSRPLTTAHYRGATVAHIPHDDAGAARHRGTRPPRLMARPFRPEAVGELARDPQRARFNLPPGVENLECVGAPECLHLPAYVLRAVEDDGGVRHLIYTRAHDGEPDADLSAACERTPEFVHTLASEESGAVRSLAERIERWLSIRGLAQYPPVRDRHGAWRVTLPPDRFHGDGRVRMSHIGSYVVLSGAFFQLWCEDRETRSWALVERLDRHLGDRLRVDPGAVRTRVDSLCRQLELGPIGLDTLRRAADSAGKAGLAERLRRAQAAEQRRTPGQIKTRANREGR